MRKAWMRWEKKRLRLFYWVYPAVGLLLGISVQLNLEGHYQSWMNSYQDSRTVWAGIGNSYTLPGNFMISQGGIMDLQMYGSLYQEVFQHFFYHMTLFLMLQGILTAVVQFFHARQPGGEEYVRSLPVSRAEIWQARIRAGAFGILLTVGAFSAASIYAWVYHRNWIRIYNLPSTFYEVILGSESFGHLILFLLFGFALGLMVYLVSCLLFTVCNSFLLGLALSFAVWFVPFYVGNVINHLMLLFFDHEFLPYASNVLGMAAPLRFAEAAEVQFYDGAVDAMVCVIYLPQFWQKLIFVIVVAAVAYVLGRAATMHAEETEHVFRTAWIDQTFRIVASVLFGMFAGRMVNIERFRFGVVLLLMGIIAVIVYIFLGSLMDLRPKRRAERSGNEE
ncbi:MAG: hypothetical protein IJ744_01540 [Lachnospiraceae bacterium]|nr:hypothetical protein [Lachnospiraceae bacterium]